MACLLTFCAFVALFNSSLFSTRFRQPLSVTPCFLLNFLTVSKG